MSGSEEGKGISPSSPFAVILMGVSGSGKSTIGSALAREWKADFKDGDAYHPQKNKAKMSKGVPLDDEDRKPWLDTLAKLIDTYVKANKRLVLACSALKLSYRSILRGKYAEDVVRVVLLNGTAEVIKERLRLRKDHFFNAKLLKSQFATLEIPQSSEKVFSVSIVDPSAEVVSTILKALTPS
eukprot:CAMPEP_0184480924 /NCGR_PEP_ID=MMETSP0113_2-20130426/2459_1 /TAXON_ID=91329 /ORGANISM="Norrisiella sphaerica, Strain BC52" /LENGTH=182 /DNA_ID=CAMNT_0026859733 /DNA_START=169 /DNA_END=717 /DNA_ORIENTATION=-